MRCAGVRVSLGWPAASTFAKHLNAILLPSGGKVYVGGIDTADIAYAYGTPVEAAAMGANEGFAASAFYSAVRTYHPMVTYAGKTTAATARG